MKGCEYTLLRTLRLVPRRPAATRTHTAKHAHADMQIACALRNLQHAMRVFPLSNLHALANEDGAPLPLTGLGTGLPLELHAQPAVGESHLGLPPLQQVFRALAVRVRGGSVSLQLVDVRP